MKYSFFNQNTLNDLLKQIEYVYKSDSRPWIIGYSGGKDSTLVVQLVYTMILNLPKEERKKNVYIISSDTLVENPIIKEYLHNSIELIRKHAISNNLPVYPHIVYPKSDQTFWVNVIGRGYPTPLPINKFRWCTDRLKIAPSGEYIQKIIEKEDSEVVILLGVRKAESIARKKRIEGREIIGKLLNRHEVIQKAYVYNPIVELTTDDVWDLLMKNKGISPWGSDNGFLIGLYTDADGGECPFAGYNKGEQTESCGKSRFGCWICTVVKEDKSLNGFIKSGYRNLIPLANFRKWLISIRDVPEYREKKRRDGIIYELPDGSKGPGPFTWEARQMILKKLLKTEKLIGYKLISEEELKAIDKIWDEELDLSRRVLVNLYYKETGNKLPWHEYKKPLFDDKIIDLLKSYSTKYQLEFELIKKLILETHKNKNYSNPKVLRNSLNKILNENWLHYDKLKELKKSYANK